MLKKIICLILGHKIIHKAYTGQQLETIGLAGNKHTINMYKFEKTDFCTRCGKKC